MKKTSGFNFGYVGGARLVKTSESHPIGVDYIHGDRSGFCGSIGMTFAPGKICNSTRDNSFWNRNIDVDVSDLATILEANVLVSLMEDFEFDEFKMTRLPNICKVNGIEFIHHPIKDMSYPKDPHSFCDLIKSLCRLLDDGKNVVIHCRGGLGRTGLVAACLLVTRGLSAWSAINMVRKVRTGTVQMKCQEDFVILFAKCFFDVMEG